MGGLCNVAKPHILPITCNKKKAQSVDIFQRYKNRRLEPLYELRMWKKDFYFSNIEIMDMCHDSIPFGYSGYLVKTYDSNLFKSSKHRGFSSDKYVTIILHPQHGIHFCEGDTRSLNDYDNRHWDRRPLRSFKNNTQY